MDEAALVSLVEKHPNLYIKARSDFKNSIKRENSWEEIGNIMGQSKEDCQRVWLNLRTRYSKELRKRKLIPSGSSCQIEEGTWPLFSSLNFLEKCIVPRKTSSNIQVSTSLSLCPSPSCSSRESGLEGMEIEFVDLSEENPPLTEENPPLTEENPPSKAALDKENRDTLKRKRNSSTTLEDKLAETAASLSSFFKNQQAENSDTAFGHYVALRLQSIPKKQKNKIKIEIMEILNKYDSD